MNSTSMPAQMPPRKPMRERVFERRSGNAVPIEPTSELNRLIMVCKPVDSTCYGSESDADLGLFHPGDGHPGDLDGLPGRGLRVSGRPGQTLLRCLLRSSFDQQEPKPGFRGPFLL